MSHCLPFCEPGCIRTSGDGKGFPSPPSPAFQQRSCSPAPLFRHLQTSAKVKRGRQVPGSRWHDPPGCRDPREQGGERKRDSTSALGLGLCIRPLPGERRAPRSRVTFRNAGRNPVALGDTAGCGGAGPGGRAEGREVRRMAPDRCSRQVGLCPICFPKKHGGLVRVGVDGRRGLSWPWEVIWGEDGVRVRRGGFTFAPRTREKLLPAGRAGWQLGWPRAGLCTRCKAHPFPARPRGSPQSRGVHRWHHGGPLGPGLHLLVASPSLSGGCSLKRRPRGAEPLN